MSISSKYPTPSLKMIAKISSGGTPTDAPMNWGGEVPFVTPPDLNGLAGKIVDETDRFLTQCGTKDSSVVNYGVAVSCRAPIGHIGSITRKSAFNQGCKVATPGDPRDTSFLAYAILANSEAMKLSGRGTTFTEMSTTAFGDIKIPWPDPSTRCRIAAFLDRETGQIDETITRIDTVIDLLRERSRALISNRLFPPGSSTQKLGRFIESLPGYAFPSEQFQSGASGPRLLRGINVKTTGVDWEDQVNLIPEGESPPEYELDAGDIVFGMDRPIVGGGTRVTEITQEDEGALLVQRVLRIRPTDHSNSRYLFYLLKSDEFANYLSVLFTGISVPHVSESQVHNFRTFFPSADEQSDIAKELDDEAEKIDLMINRASLVKNLLGERRAALITTAVTGRVEV